MALILKRLERELGSAEQQEARELAETVGFLPLALELSAAQALDLAVKHQRELLAVRLKVFLRVFASQW